MSRLRIKNGPLAGTALTLGEGVRLIGHSWGNDLRIPDPSVSENHCEVMLDQAGHLFVRDRSSVTGTSVDGHRVSEALMTLGQVLQVGEVELVFESDPPPAVGPPADVAQPAKPPEDPDDARWRPKP